MKILQLGSNRGNDALSHYIKTNKVKLDFALFVEANSLHIDQLKECYKDYSNAIIDNVAIKVPSFASDDLEIFYSTKDGPYYEIASCDVNHIHKHMKMCPHLVGGEIKSFRVPCITLDDLFSKHKIAELDWLLIDLEGIDAELLLTTDWSKYNINKIEFENIHLGENKEKIRALFKGLGYTRTNALHKFDEAWIKTTDNKMKVTLYAIAKNEETNVEKFIKNSKKFDDVVVVDTGSSDKTVELLKEAGIKVFEHPQTREDFDFALARNTALSYVETEWALSLDFNEDIDEYFPEGLSVIADEFTSFRHLRFDDIGKGDPVQSSEVHTRFHRTKNYKWINAVHEIPSFVPTEKYPEEVSVDTTIKITKKINRTVDKELFYLSLVERELSKDPENTYYLWFAFNHYLSVGNQERALSYGQDYLNYSRAYFDTFRVDVFIRLSILLLNIQDYNKAANYAFHALSEAMNLGSIHLGKAFTHLNKLAMTIKNPNLIVFATGFSEDTIRSEERKLAIQQLSNELNPD